MKEEQVKIEIGEQHILGVLHLPEDAENVPVVVLVHGWGNNKTGPHRMFVRSARRFAPEGFAGFRFDFRGSGGSSMKFEEQTHTTMLEDLEKVLNFLESRPELGDITLLGHSQGGYVSLLKAAQDQRVENLIIWMGRCTDRKDWYPEQLKNELERKGYFVCEDKKVTREYFEDACNYSSERVARKIDIPVKMLYGTKDREVPVSEGEKLKGILNTDTELEVVEGLDHMFNGEENKRTAIQQTLNWLEESN